MVRPLMVVLAIVAVACFLAGVWTATTWLPALAEGSVGMLVYFVVCGLAGATLALFGIHIWQIVNELKYKSTGFFRSSEIVASGLGSLLWDSGSLAALTLVAYLLAPKAHEPSAEAAAVRAETAAKLPDPDRPDATVKDS